MGSFTNIADALRSSEDGGPCTGFLRECMGGSDFSLGPWVACQSVAGLTTHQMKYRCPLPSDIPEFIARLLGMGKTVGCSVVTQLIERDAQVILQFMTRAEGLLYSERMRIVNCHVFQPCRTGGVSWYTLTEIVWLRPLPWTHAFITRIVWSDQERDEGARPEIDGPDQADSCHKLLF